MKIEIFNFHNNNSVSARASNETLNTSRGAGSSNIHQICITKLPQIISVHHASLLTFQLSHPNGSFALPFNYES